MAISKKRREEIISKHPALYTIFKPNELIKAKKKGLSLMEWKVYNEILNHNHKNDNQTTVYDVKYDLIFDVSDTHNKAANIKRISENLQNRKFYLDKKFMFEHFGENVPASLLPFPFIKYYDDHFKVHLQAEFKKILTMVDLGFTKGDIEKLRILKHEMSHVMYWFIRKNQVWKNVIEIELEKFKEFIGLEDKYKDYKDFKKRVLDPLQEEFKGMYEEFTYEPIKKGRGGAVVALKFIFANGPDDEEDVPAGTVYDFESKLLSMQVAADKVKEIRQRVKINQESEKFQWDYDYVKFSIEAAVNQLREIEASAKKTKVKSVGAWLYSGLVDGRWLGQVERRKAQVANRVQHQLTFDVPAEVVNGDPNSKQAVPVGALPTRTICPTEEWRALWEEAEVAGKMKMTFEEFMIHHRWIKDGEIWYKED